MYIVYLLIIVLLILLFILLEDKISMLKIISIILISSGTLILVFGITIKILIKITIYYINLSKATNFILNNFVAISIILILSGIFSYIMYRIIKPKSITN